MESRTLHGVQNEISLVKCEYLWRYKEKSESRKFSKYTVSVIVALKADTFNVSLIVESNIPRRTHCLGVHILFRATLVDEIMPNSL